MSEEQKTYNVRLEGINIIEKALFKIVPSESEEFSFDIKAQSIADDKKNIIVTFISIAIKKITNPGLLAKLVCAFGFQIEHFENSLEKTEDNKYIIPNDLDNLLKNISISTMRGILFSELRGTHLHNAVLPIIMMNSLVPVEGNVIETP